MGPVRFPRKEHFALAVIFFIAVVLPIVVMGWRQAIFLVIVNVIVVLVIGEHNRVQDRNERWKKQREESIHKDTVLSFDLSKSKK